MKLILFCIFCFAYVPYTLQEDMESGGSESASSDLVCNAIYKSLGHTKSFIYVELCKRQEAVIVLMSTVIIPNIDVKVWIRKMITIREISLPTFLKRNPQFQYKNHLSLLKLSMFK